MKGFLVKVIDKRGVAVGTMTAPGGLQTITCGFNVSGSITSIVADFVPMI